MNMTDQGYFNAVISVSEPETIHEFFEPSGPGEFHSRLDDVEMSLQYINEMLNSDAMMNCLNTEEVLKVNAADLMMKGLVLERIRFRILRDEWEPMFDPLPTNPSENYDPDIFPEHKWIAVHFKDDDGEYVERSMVQIHDKEASGLYDDDTDFARFWVNWQGIEVESDSLVDLLDELHNKTEEQFEEYIADQVGQKSVRLLVELQRLPESDVTVEDLEKLK
jgi:hypothetical protein